MNILSTLFFIILGILIIYTGTTFIAPNTEAELGFLKYPIGLFFISLGIASYIDNKKKKIVYSKCQKCKESFSYIELKDGMCPKCNIKTIDIEKYYNKNNRDN